MSMKRGRPSSLVRRFAAALSVGAIGLLGACGGDADEGADSSATVTTAPTSTTSPAVESTAPATTANVDTVPSTESATPSTEREATATTQVADMDEVSADDIPVAFTPTGGWNEMPSPVLAACTEPLVDGAVDMRGTWDVVSVSTAEGDVPGHEAIGERQRIEQCGNRVVITAGGIIHDMRADGTEAGGVHDVAAADMTTPITVVASFEDGVHVLRPVGAPIEIKRWIDGDQLVWEYVGFTARLDRVEAS